MKQRAGHKGIDARPGRPVFDLCPVVLGNQQNGKVAPRQLPHMGSQFQYLHILQPLAQQQGTGHPVFILCFRKPGDRVHAFFCADHLQAALLQITGNLCRPVIPAFRQHNRQTAGKHGFLFAVQCGGHGNHHFKTAAHALPAFHTDLSAHAFHQVFHNGHSKAGAFDFADGSVIDPLKRQENFLQEFLTHADSVILAGKFQQHRVLFPFFFPVLFRPALPETNIYISVFQCILNRIPDNIHQNLPQPQGVPHQAFFINGPDVYHKTLFFQLCLGTHDHGNIMHQVCQGKHFLIQGHAPAVNARHVQHVIDQAHQMGGSRLDLLQAVLYPGLLIYVGQTDGSHSHNGIHGSPDVMGHIGKEIALGLVGRLRSLQGVLQRVIHLLQLLPALQTVLQSVQNPQFMPIAQHHLILFQLPRRLLRVCRQQFFHGISGQSAGAMVCIQNPPAIPPPLYDQISSVLFLTLCFPVFHLQPLPLVCPVPRDLLRAVYDDRNLSRPLSLRFPYHSGQNTFRPPDHYIMLPCILQENFLFTCGPISRKRFFCNLPALP